MSSLAVLGWGTAVPPRKVSQARAAEVAGALAAPGGAPEPSISVLYRRSGIDTRHTVLSEEAVLDWSRAPGSPAALGAAGLGPSTAERMERYEEEAPPLALLAAREALGASGLPAGSITHLVTVSCTGFAAPGVDLALMSGLGLAPTVERTHVGFMGCHGALNGLRVARALLAGDPRARVLLSAVELCSLHYYYGADRQKLVGNALFADGAAAVVGAPPAAAPEGAWRAAACGSMLFADSAGDMTWAIGDHGFEMALSTRVPDLIQKRLRPWLDEWLRGLGLSLEEVRSWAIHPGGPRILSAVERGLDLPRQATQASREVLAECGNMSSPTVLFILRKLSSRGAPRPCVALGFGPGLVAEAGLFD